MNTDILEGRWKQIRGQVKEWWAELTDDDLNQVEGKSERLVGMLQERYGYSRERAQQEVKERMQEYNSSDNYWNFLSGILLGVVIGAAIMLFYAPQSGRKMRREVRRKTMHLRDQAMDTAEDLQGRASEVVTGARKKVGSARKQIQRRGEEVAEEVRAGANRARKAAGVK
jgi:uncharacterized protein YjbJ (UPF0337 family)